MRKSKHHTSALLKHLGNAMRDRRVDLSLTQEEVATAAPPLYGRLTDALHCALSLPILDAERGMTREALPSMCGVRGALSKAIQLLHSSSRFCSNLRIESFELEVRANMSKLQFAVEMYARKHNAYPKDLEELEESLSGQSLINPFTKSQECQAT